MKKMPSPPSGPMFTVYGKKGCPHTDKAIADLAEHDFRAPEDVKLVYLETPEELRKITKAATFPQVYMQKNRIGGSDQLVGFLKEYTAHLDSASDTDSGSDYEEEKK